MKLGTFIPNNVKQDGDYGFSTTASRFAALTIAVGLLALIIAFAILNGFKSHIKNVVYDFNGEYQISSINGMVAGKTTPIKIDSGFYQDYEKRFPEIEHVFALATKGFLLQHDSQIEGLIIKGYDEAGLTNINAKLIEGENLDPDSLRNVLVSELVSKKLGLKVGDSFVGNFFTNSLKHRKLKVVGVYKTNLSEFDKVYVIAPMDLVLKLNKWKEGEAEAIEVHMKKGYTEEDYYKFSNYLNSEIAFDLRVTQTNYDFAHLFQWLMILDQNVQVLIVILFILVLFSVISTMYILIYERNHMVGVLKSLGASNRQILSVFILQGVKIGLWGLFVGNVLSLLFLYVQKYLKVIGLDPEHYYMDYVPVEIDWWNIISINLISAIVVFTLLLIPYLIVMRMKPVDNLRFN